MTAIDDYRKRLELNKKNAQIELNRANQTAQSNANAYLQTLGLQNTGVQLNYSNQMNDIYQRNLGNITAQYQTQLDNKIDEYNTTKKAEMQSALDSMSDYQQQMNYLNKMSNDRDIASYTFNDLRNNLNVNWENNARGLKDSLLQMYNNEENAVTQKQYMNQYNELNNAINSGDYAAMANAYKNASNLINGQSSASELDENGNINADIYTGEIDATTLVASNLTDRGHEWNSLSENQINALTNALNKGDIKINNGTIVDFNGGLGTDLYQYNSTNKTWRKIDNSKEHKNSSISIRQLFKDQNMRWQDYRTDKTNNSINGNNASNNGLSQSEMNKWIRDLETQITNNMNADNYDRSQEILKVINEGGLTTKQKYNKLKQLVG